MYQEIAGYALWVWGLAAVIAILVGIAAARIFTLTPSQRIMRRECPECGSSKLLLRPRSKSLVLCKCEDCGSIFELHGEGSDQPIQERPAVTVTQLGMAWDGETGNLVFRTKIGSAEFDLRQTPITALAHAKHPREALRLIADAGIRPVRCTVGEGTEDAWLTFLESAGIERTEQ